MLDAYIWLLCAVCFVGFGGCMYLLGRVDGIQSEKKRAAYMRRMTKGKNRW